MTIVKVVVAQGLLSFALLLAVAVALSGCATTPEPTARGVCLALAPHMPQKLRPRDTEESKVEGYRRNVVYVAVCPGGGGGP